VVLPVFRLTPALMPMLNGDAVRPPPLQGLLVSRGDNNKAAIAQCRYVSHNPAQCSCIAIHQCHIK